MPGEADGDEGKEAAESEPCGQVEGRGNAVQRGQSTRSHQFVILSESAVEKHSNAIFAKLGLTEEPQVHRRVAAVLTYLRDVGS